MYSFAHISDLHLPPMPSVEARELMNKRVLGYLSWHRKRKHRHRAEVVDALLADLNTQNPDHICVTGDQTNIGLPDEFVNSVIFLESLGTTEKVSVIPGNHDAYVKDSIPYILRSWSKWMGPSFPYVHRRGPIAFIGLNSGVPTAPFMATGTVSDDQLDLLAQMLAGEQFFKVVMIHHPPVPGTTSPRKALTNDKNLCKVIEECGAHVVIHGHTHHPYRGQIGDIPVFGAGSASLKKGAHYHFFKLENTQLTVIHREYDAAQDAFVETASETLAIQPLEELTIAKKA